MRRYPVWFYGLVRDKHYGIILSEIYPGIGYSDFDIDRDDGDLKPVDPQDQYVEIATDLMYRNPEELAREYPDAKYVDLGKQLEEAAHKPAIDFKEFEDDRSLFLKLMDARYVLDFFLDNKSYAYYPDDVGKIANLSEYVGLMDDIELLEKYNIIRQRTTGCYELNKECELTQILIALDNAISEKATHDQQ
jgi:hypothetical protein